MGVALESCVFVYVAWTYGDVCVLFRFDGVKIELSFLCGEWNSESRLRGLIE